MFNVLIERIERVRRGQSDRGAALVIVMGIMLVGAVTTTTLALVTMYNTTLTLEQKEQRQALQSADAGLDITFDQLAGKKYNELYQVCGGTYTLNNDVVVVETEYVVDTGASVATTSCPTATDIVMTMKIRSTATTQGLIPDGEPVVRTSVATLMPVPPEVVLDKAVFTEGTTTITNNSEFLASGAVDENGNPVQDAHIYSNGGLVCATQNEIEGQIIAAHGDVEFPNNCKIYSSVWASGKVWFKTGAQIYGDLYAASFDDKAVENNNGGYVQGAVLTNGGVYTEAKNQNGSGFRGLVFARTGPIEYKNNAYIGGSAYAGGNFDIGNGGYVGGDILLNGGSITGRGDAGRHIRVTGTVSNQVNAGGTISEGVGVSFPTTPYPADTFPAAVGYPTNIQEPPREQMPIVTMNDQDKALWAAAGYVEEHTDQCTGSGPANTLNQDTGGVPRLIIFDCPSNTPVTFTNQVNIFLRGNVAMVSNTGFSTENKFHVTTDSTGDPYKMHWIVPADAPGVTWVSADAGQTSPVCANSNTGLISLANNVDVSTVESMAYTPCRFYQKNGWNKPWIGQVYAGHVTMQNGFLLQMTSVPVPSLADSEPNPNSEVEMQVLARFDEHG